MASAVEPPAPGSAGRYRPDIDGLRAIALLAVVAFHVAPGRLPSGFIGVDIFFVISGFLISSILVRELEEGRFGFLSFYRRRIRRIFPALILVLACSLAIGWILLTDADFKRFGFHLAASAAFVPNFALWREAGYFDVYPFAKPLLHLWSLGIEEQYYALWPLFLFLCWRFRTGFLIPVAAVAAASFALNVHQSAVDPIGTFYSPLTRFWELLLGGLLALMARRGVTLDARSADLASLAGLAALAAGLALIDSHRPFPGWWALLPTLGTFLLILAGPRAWPNKRLLALRPMVWIGLISYPLYLWHWPLLSFTHISAFDGLPPAWRLAVAALAFPLAWATYVFVERPIRWKGRVPVSALCLAMAALAAAGAAVFIANGVPSRRLADDPRREFLSLYRNLPSPEPCTFGSPGRGLRRRALPDECVSAGSRGTWFLWGDSHARSLVPGLERSLPQGYALAKVTTGGCRPAAPSEPTPWPACRRSNAYAFARIAQLRPEIVLLTQRGDFARRDWEALARRIRAAGARKVVLIGPAPEWQWGLPNLVVRRHWPEVPARVRRDLVPYVLAEDRMTAERLRGSRDVHYVSLTGALCTEQGCRARVPGLREPRLMAQDYGHLSPWGSLFVARTIIVPALDRMESSPAGRR